MTTTILMAVFLGVLAVRLVVFVTNALHARMRLIIATRLVAQWAQPEPGGMPVVDAFALANAYRTADLLIENRSKAPDDILVSEAVPPPNPFATEMATTINEQPKESTP